MSLPKKILKALIPIPLLKKAFLTYNKLKIRSIDRIMFSEQKIPDDAYLIHQSPCPFADVDMQDVSLPIRIHVEKWNTWSQEEYLLRIYFPCVVEPKYGWAFSGSNKLIYQSLSFSRTTHQRKPSLLGYWFRRDVQKIPQAISLRDTGEENYFHFYNDVLAKLFWLNQNGIDVIDIPIIISDKLWSKGYFQGYLNSSTFLSELTWVIQKDQFIKCDSLYLVKAPTHKKDIWDAIFKIIPTLPTPKSTRIFISRRKSRLRYLKNEEEIISKSRQLGFQIVDNDDLSIEHQANLYAQASFIIGIHGSGLTNMYFRHGECRVLEIFPSLNQGYLPFHYIMLAKMKGFRYQAVIGEELPGDLSGGFNLSPALFDEAVKELLL